MVVQFAALVFREAGECPMWCRALPLLPPLGSRLMQPHHDGCRACGVQDNFAAHVALVHRIRFQGGTILVHHTGFVAIALCYQLAARVTYDG